MRSVSVALARWLALAVLVLVILGGAAVAVVTEGRPLVVASATPGSADARRLKALSKSFKKALKKTDRRHFTVLAEDEAAGILAFAARGLGPSWAATAVIEEGRRLRLSATAVLPGGRYLNPSLVVESSADGLRFAALRAGEITLPGWAIPLLARLFLDRFMETGAGEILLSAVRAVDIDEGRVRVTYRFKPDDYAMLKLGFNRAVALYQPLGDPDLVRLYYQRVVAVGKQQHLFVPNVLGSYLNPAFALAADRTKRGGNPVTENRAALLAVTLYCGPTIFERAVGKVRTQPRFLHYPRCRFTQLRGRRDLALHFVFSAYLRMVSDVAPAFVVGEIKELLDSSRGGSGFSFDDLAADRAGLRLAEAALRSPESALRVQGVLAQDAGDDAIFPDSADLPSGMAEHEFQAAFGSIDDPRYRDMLALIDRRIDALPLYSGDL